MRSLLKTCLVVAGVMILFRIVLFTSFSIPSEGMENTLLRGDRVLVNRWSYGWRLPFASYIGGSRLGNGAVSKGEVVVFNNPAPREVERRVENREVFIGRCIGLPGDTLYLNRELLPNDDRSLSPNRKLLYAYPIGDEAELTQALAQLELRDDGPMGYDEGFYMRSFSAYELYLLKQAVRNRIPFRCLQSGRSDEGWTVVVPAKGKRVPVLPGTVKLLCNTINQHEGRHALVKGEELWVDGRRVTSFTFTKDYYWMASDNSMSLCDSRLFGFVPKDHLIGRAVLVWFSSDWSRLFHTVR